eukprot:1160358-Pelagomonas_calceolata.AAC.8
MDSPEFDEWCEKCGVQRGCCEAAYVSDGWRGIIATSPLKPGDVLLQVGNVMCHIHANAKTNLRDRSFEGWACARSSWLRRQAIACTSAVLWQTAAQREQLGNGSTKA